jgi:hypothetical protein
VRWTASDRKTNMTAATDCRGSEPEAPAVGMCKGESGKHPPRVITSRPSSRRHSPTRRWDGGSCPWRACRRGECACRRPCEHPAKHPITAHGVHDATTDPVLIAGVVEKISPGERGGRHWEAARAWSSSTSTCPATGGSRYAPCASFLRRCGRAPIGSNVEWLRPRQRGGANGNPVRGYSDVLPGDDELGRRTTFDAMGAGGSMNAGGRRARARIAAYALHAKYDSRDLTRAARAAFLERFEREVDPESILPPAERHRRAEAAKRAYFLRLARRSAAVRARRDDHGSR